MPEFLGYQPEGGSGFVEFSRLSKQLGTDISEAIGTRGRERDAFEKVRLKNEKEINEYEVGQNQTINDLVLDGANNIKGQMYNWKKAADNGEMTRAEYKRRTNNVSSYWKMLSEAAKNYDQRSIEILNRQQPGEGGFIPGSGFELFTNGKFAEIADLKGKTIYTNPDTGKIYLTSINDNGEIVSQNDVRQMNNPGNLLDNRINLSDTVSSGTKGWKEWTTFTEGARGSSRSVTDVRKNPEFLYARNALIDSILANDRAVAGVLVDNNSGDYRFYSDESELDSELNNAADQAERVADEAGIDFNRAEFISGQEKMMIQVSKDSTGTYQPVPTDEQKNAARRRVQNEIELHLGFKETGKTKRAPRVVSSSGKDSDDKKDDDDTALYDQVRDAWILSNEDREESASVLTSASGGKYRFNWEEGGLSVTKLQTEEDEQTGEFNYPVIATGIKSLRDLAPYFFGTGTGTAGTRGSFKEYDRQREISQKRTRSRRSNTETLSAQELIDKYSK